MKNLILSLLVFIPFSLFAQQLGENAIIPLNSNVYALPLTSVEVKVEIEEEVYIKGPYASYADIYISVPNAPTENGVMYRICNVEMKPVMGADYETMFTLPFGLGKSSHIDFLSLTSEGLVSSGADFTPFKMDLNNPVKGFQVFPDRLPSSPMITKKITSYDRVKTDTGFIHVPYKQSIVNEKDPERKAEEAAKFIFTLRQRRLELITGDVDNAFSGSSLKDALNEIERLENEYLSLFLGKSSVKRNTYVFYVTPNNTKNRASYNVFRFSENSGVVPEDHKAGRMITLDVQPEGRIRYVEGINIQNSKSLIYYRIPETATIHLMDNGKEICRGRIQISQMGKILSYPTSSFIKK